MGRKSFIVNTWQSKTYCQKTDCQEDQLEFEAYAASLLPFTLRLTKTLTLTPFLTEIKNYRRFQHYCGAEPRYIFFYHFQRKPVDTFIIEGGQKWFSALVVVPTSITNYKVSFAHDGCWTPIDLLKFIAILAHDPLLLIDSEYLYRDPRSPAENPKVTLEVWLAKDIETKGYETVAREIVAERLKLGASQRRYEPIFDQPTEVKAVLFENEKLPQLKLLFTKADNGTRIFWVYDIGYFKPIIAEYGSYVYRYYNIKSALQLIAYQHASVYQNAEIVH